MQVFSLVCFMSGEFKSCFLGSLFCSLTHGKVKKTENTMGCSLN